MKRECGMWIKKVVLEKIEFCGFFMGMGIRWEVFVVGLPCRNSRLSVKDIGFINIFVLWKIYDWEVC